MKKYFFTQLMLLCMLVHAHAQFNYPPTPAAPVNITNAEYFIDNDPGFGLATTIPVSAALDIPALAANVNINGLTPGVHKLQVRTRDAGGRWSLTGSATFENYQPAYGAAPAAAVNLVRAEYFIDTDPGFGLATAIPLTAALNIPALAFSANINGLTPGVHKLQVRSQDANGRWSLTGGVTFENYQPAHTAAPASAVNITKLEYFIDTDPGFSQGVNVPVSPAQNISNLLVNIDLGTVGAAGNHRLFMRSADANGNWSLTGSGQFNNAVYVYPAAAAPEGNIIALEYFFDNDPGFGNGIPVSITQTANISNFVFAANLTGLTPDADHVLFVRSKESPWSLTSAVVFRILGAVPVSILSFTGTLKNEDVLLRWVTSNEINSSHFEIERSRDGTHFTKIGTLPSAGNSNTDRLYNFEDKNAADGVLYYRLKQVDLNGSFKYSPVIRLKKQSSISILPNPVSNQFVLKGLAAGTKYSIYDAAGKLIVTEVWNGQYANAGNLPAGMYTIKIETNGQTMMKQFVKQ